MVPETWTMSRSFGMTNWWWRLTDAGDADFAKRRRSDGKSTDGTKNPFELPKKSCKVSQEWPENPQEKDLSYQSYLLFFWSQPWYDCLLFTQVSSRDIWILLSSGRNGTPAPGTPARAPQRVPVTSARRRGCATEFWSEELDEIGNSKPCWIAPGEAQIWFLDILACDFIVPGFDF